ncbi:MAG: sigma-70 family RNA polymerase sigma factor [Deltaproteobacteria bacterium]|nr:sigma-70 family RNA polymerase sigma factor [Deltaproteobacteria bacterium]
MNEFDEEQTEEYQLLLQFLTDPGPRFALGMVRYADSRLGATLRERVVTDIAGRGLKTFTLQLTDDDVDKNLVRKLADAIEPPNGNMQHRILMVLGIERLIVDPVGRPRRVASVANLNQSRDLLPEIIDARILFWVPTIAYAPFQQYLRDLSDVMLVRADFLQTYGREYVPAEILARWTSEWRRHELPPRSSARDQLGPLEDLYSRSSELAAADLAATIAGLHRDLYLWEKARDWHERSARLYEQNNEPRQAIIQRLEIAESFIAEGQHRAARTLLQDLVKGHINDDLAPKVYLLLAEALLPVAPHQAETVIEGNVLPQLRRLGDKVNEAQALEVIVESWEARGRRDEAAACLRDFILPIYDELELTDHQARTLIRLAANLKLPEHFPQALELVRDRALPLAWRNGNIKLRLNAEEAIAQLYESFGSLDQARRVRARELTTYDDAGLLQRWQLGDRASGDVLIARHYPRIRAYFGTRVPLEDVEDLVSQTFLALLETKNRHSGISSFRSFLFRLARNIRAQHLRNLRPGKSLADVDSIYDDEEPQPDFLTIQNEQMHHYSARFGLSPSRFRISLNFITSKIFHLDRSQSYSRSKNLRFGHVSEPR